MERRKEERWRSRTERNEEGGVGVNPGEDKAFKFPDED